MDVLLYHHQNDHVVDFNLRYWLILEKFDQNLDLVIIFNDIVDLNYHDIFFKIKVYVIENFILFYYCIENKDGIYSILNIWCSYIESIFRIIIKFYYYSWTWCLLFLIKLQCIIFTFIINCRTSNFVKERVFFLIYFFIK